MADVTCSICLEQLKLPVVIPCGHVHCEKCLTSHIQSGKDAIHSHCPTCRTVFNIAIPDWRYVPKKYHEFMIPSVRKVYIEIPSQAGLKNQIALLESRVKSLENDKLLLMTKCESNMAASVTHQEGEKKARIDVEKVKKEVVNLKRKYDVLKGKYNDLKPREQTLNSHSSSHSLDIEENSLNSNEIRDGRLASRPKRPLPSRATRSSFPLVSYLDDSLMMLHASPTLRKRPQRSAPELVEDPPSPAISNTAVAEQLHASGEGSTELQRRRVRARRFPAREV